MAKPTREQVIGEPAGRRLDAWVGEYVTNWKPTGIFRYFGGEPCQEQVPHYSTDMRAAMYVVDNLSARGCSLVLEDLRSFCLRFRGNWTAMFDLPDGHDTGQRDGETAAHAICIAALIAVTTLPEA